jgi:hypothetical protein
MTYINRRGQGHTETVDEFETRAEARKALQEYLICDTSADYWISQRCCANWKEK